MIGQHMLANRMQTATFWHLKAPTGGNLNPPAGYCEELGRGRGVRGEGKHENFFEALKISEASSIPSAG